MNKKQMRLIADRIKLFREDCERDEYTDTGDAWVLLDEAETALRAAIIHAHAKGV